MNNLIHNPARLNIGALILAAIKMEYGWTLSADGQTLEEGPNAEKLPEFDQQKLKYERFDLFDRRFMGTATKTEAFHAVYTDARREAFQTNIQGKKAPATEILVIAGIKIREAAGASDALVGALDFDTINQNTIKNALLSIDFNDKKVIDNTVLDAAINGDINNPAMLSFAKFRCVRPGSTAKVTIEAPSAVGNYWTEQVLVGYKVEVTA